MREELARTVFACICHAVTDDEVAVAVDMGAATVEAVGTVTGAGTGCGSCRSHLEDLIVERACPMVRQQA
jgi:bacterioferritin-associated ferredoxin